MDFSDIIKNEERLDQHTVPLEEVKQFGDHIMKQVRKSRSSDRLRILELEEMVRQLSYLNQLMKKQFLRQERQVSEIKRLMCSGFREKIKIEKK